MNSHPWISRIRNLDSVRRTGRVERIFSTYIEASGPAVPLGTLCQLPASAGGMPTNMVAEVIRVDRTNIALAPLETGFSILPGAIVTALPTTHLVPVGDSFLSRAIDPLGRPLDGTAAVAANFLAPLHGEPLPPLERQTPKKILETGIRAIDGLLTLGRGQRVGIFAAAGVGKTSIVAQLAAHVQADITVIALVGERGREVELLWDELPADVKLRSAMVAATSDQPATLRVRAAYYAMALADHWRSRGKHVLLLFDSITRFAMALREIGLAAGEPPTVRAYTPNVFAAVPRLVERAGALRSGGAISAILTVLSESDEIDDPICEMMKSLLDGHILLSRTMAEDGHYPAIDVLKSVSRQAADLVPSHQLQRIRSVTRWMSAFEQSRMVREAGLYVPGADAAIDEAVSRRADVVAFLQQGRHERSSIGQTGLALSALTASRARHVAA